MSAVQLPLTESEILAFFLKPVILGEIYGDDKVIDVSDGLEEEPMEFP